MVPIVLLAYPASAFVWVATFRQPIRRAQRHALGASRYVAVRMR